MTTEHVYIDIEVPHRLEEGAPTAIDEWVIGYLASLAEADFVRFRAIIDLVLAKREIALIDEPPEPDVKP
jgi:hypothetical protein